MKYIFIYQASFCIENFSICRAGRTYKIIKEKKDAYFLENIKNKYDQILLFKIDNLNGKIVEETNDEVKHYSAIFIYDDEQNGHEEKKILIMLDVDKLIKNELDKINEKIKSAYDFLENRNVNEIINVK